MAKTASKLSLTSLSLLVSTCAWAASDPCATTFADIATALDAGNAEAALAHFTVTDRGGTAIRDAAAVPAAAARLAAVFRTAKLKTTFDSSAVYTANWEASLGHSYAIDIGAQVGAQVGAQGAWCKHGESMIYNINRDHARFRSIVKGKIKQDLKKYVTHGEMIGRKGKDMVTIPVPQIDIPKFRFGDREQGGVGQGEGKPGDPVGGQPGDGDGEGQAGNTPGQHLIEVDLTLQELAEILGEQLELPKIEPRGHKTVKSKTEKYTGIASQGPNSLRHFKRTFKETLRRQISTGTYNPDNPIIVPIKRDMKFRSWKTDVRHENNAVIIYMMDVSGSMGDEQKEIVRTEAFWIDTWLRSQYKGIETRYIIHDATAREVDEDTFFRTRESGGTLISSAYKLCEKIIETDYAPSDWNIYPFHFSDGDNWSGEDTRLCLDIMEKTLLTMCNVFCYGQVESRYGSGQFYKDLKEHFGSDHDSVILSKIENKEGILQSIKDFLGKGK